MLLPLVQLSSARLAELFGMRAARLYAMGVALSFAVLIFLSRAPASLWTIDVLLIRALKSMSWLVAGLSSLSAARDLERRDREEGLAALVAQRGHDMKSLELSRVLAAALRIAFWVGVPSLALVLAGWLRLSDLTRWSWAVGWLAFICAYALALGITLGALARAASRISPQRGRLLLFTLVLAPELVRSVWPPMPSIPGIFAWALGEPTDRWFFLG